MKVLVLALAFLSLSGAAFGQRRLGQFWSLGGHGNILFPGTGHAPTTPPGATAPYFLPQGSVPPHTAAGPQQHPVVTLPSPVYDGGYPEDRSGNELPSDPSETPFVNSTPPVINPPPIINPGLAPSLETVRAVDLTPENEEQACPNTQGSAQTTRAGAEDRPTIYLIAFKDHSIVQALGYWMEAGTLHYVSAEYTLNQASIALIDRDLSRRLNNERGLAFNIPTPK